MPGGERTCLKDRQFTPVAHLSREKSVSLLIGLLGYGLPVATDSAHSPFVASGQLTGVMDTHTVAVPLVLEEGGGRPVVSAFALLDHNVSFRCS